ncbi:MAG: SAM-dependent chlorinase/fluorinase [Bacteroidota bacterium]
MQIVTLTTDWGIRDFYVGALKAAILNASENITIIDISHFVQPFDLLSGAFIFRNAYQKFPNGVIHIIGVVAQAESDAGMIAIKYKGQYFIGTNDGFFSLVFDETPEEIISINPSSEKHTGFDQAAAVSAIKHLTEGKDFKNLGKPIENFITKTHLRPVIEEKLIKGTVIYIDAYENVVTNITRKLFENIGNGKKFEINARRNEYTINSLSEKYSDAERGQLLALFNSAGYLEIALNQGNAAGLLGMNYGDIIRIDFK